MFGYVLPHIPNLKVYENEIYKATYCGLCREIKKRFGQLSRFNLSYDMVFLTIFLICYLGEEFNFEKKLCKLHPFRRRLCLKSCDALEKAANIGVILFYYKIKDNVMDCKRIKKLLNIVLSYIFRRSFKRAEKKEKKIADFVYDFIEKQTNVEKQKCATIDYYADPTATCIGEIFESFSKSVDEKNSLYRIGYMLGKYIYIMDALDDLPNDIKNKNFNPILEMVKKENKSEGEIIGEISQLINFSVAQLAESFEELQISKEKDILKNIIYLGLKSTKQKIFLKLKNKKFLLEALVR